MKIAIIDHIINPGGAARFLRSLLPALHQVRPDLEITLFGHGRNIHKEGLDQICAQNNIHIEKLSSVHLSGQDLFRIKGSRHIISLLQRKLSKLLSFTHPFLSGAIHQELERKVKGYDLALFIWPYHIQCPSLDCPMVSIFHDFNFRYYFSPAPPWIRKNLFQETPKWLQNSTPIVLVDFMRAELEKFYPEYAHKAHIIPVASTSGQPPSTPFSRPLPPKYILCPTNTCVHKNILPLLSAFSIIRKKHPDIALVFVGSGTNELNGRACHIGLELDMQPQDVFGLGYVSNEELDQLVSGALLVVNASLYEGGNLPAFDAWTQGVPVAMSSIPTFLEHLSARGVQAHVFDPFSPQDIAQKIEEILLSPQAAHQQALESQNQIAKYSWKDVAAQYAEVFSQLYLRSFSRKAGR